MAVPAQELFQRPPQQVVVFHNQHFCHLGPNSRHGDAEEQSKAKFKMGRRLRDLRVFVVK
jgi:hypothetical protein